MSYDEQVQALARRCASLTAERDALLAERVILLAERESERDDVEDALDFSYGHGATAGPDVEAA